MHLIFFAGLGLNPILPTDLCKPPAILQGDIRFHSKRSLKRWSFQRPSLSLCHRRVLFDLFRLPAVQKLSQLSKSLHRLAFLERGMPCENLRSGSRNFPILCERRVGKMPVRLNFEWQRPCKRVQSWNRLP